MEKFATLQEIIEIYCISRKLVRDILRHNNVDCYEQEGELYINFKEFHQIYTTKYNPVLFTIEDKPKEEKKPIIENTINRTFFNIFSEPVNYRQKLKRGITMAYAG